MEPPKVAITWPESELRLFFESGGDSVAPLNSDAAPDVIIPFGEWCAVATILSALDARSASFPLDWIYTSLPALVEFLEAGCAPDFLLSGPSNLCHVLPHNRTAPAIHEWQIASGPGADKPSSDTAEQLAWPGDAATTPLPVASLNEGDGLLPGCHVRDQQTGVIFPHDFGEGLLESQFEAVYDKYRRRCARLSAVLQSRSVLLLHVRNSYLSGERSPYDAELVERLDRALRRWPHTSHVPTRRRGWDSAATERGSPALFPSAVLARLVDKAYEGEWR